MWAIEDLFTCYWMCFWVSQSMQQWKGLLLFCMESPPGVIMLMPDTQLYKLAWHNNHTKSMVYNIMTSKTVHLVSDTVNPGSSLNHQTDLPCLSCVSTTLITFVWGNLHFEHRLCRTQRPRAACDLCETTDAAAAMLLQQINQPHPPPAYSSLSVEFHMFIQRRGECCSGWADELGLTTTWHWGHSQSVICCVNSFCVLSNKLETAIHCETTYCSYSSICLVFHYYY